MIPRLGGALGVLLLLAGCVSPSPATTPPTTAPDAPASASAPPAAEAVLRPRPTFAAATTITAAGVGPARVGMTVAEGTAARILAAPPRVCVDPRTDAFLRAFPGVAVEWTDGGLRTVVVGSTAYATETGVRAGDTRARLERAYGDRLRLVPRDLAHFENLGGRGGPLNERFGPVIPAVEERGGVLLFPLFEGRVDHIQVVPPSTDRLLTYAGECA